MQQPLEPGTPLPASLLGLPPEIRLQIFTLALQKTSQRRKIPLLLTCRKIYEEARALPLQLFPVSLSYRAHDSHLDQLLPNLREPWQVANVRLLVITWLYPRDFESFLNFAGREIDIAQTCPSSIPQNPATLPLQNLDTLTIWAYDWLTKSRTSPWRRVANPQTDVHAGIPGPDPSYLFALVQRSRIRFKQLDLVFPEMDLTKEYWERRQGFIDPLMQNFRQRERAERRRRLRQQMGKSTDEREQDRDPLKGNDQSESTSKEQKSSEGEKEEDDDNEDDMSQPEWTIYHYPPQFPGHYNVERLYLLHTASLHRHTHPQWHPSSLPALRSGRTCIYPPPPSSPSTAKISTRDNEERDAGAPSSSSTSSGGDFAFWPGGHHTPSSQTAAAAGRAQGSRYLRRENGWADVDDSVGSGPQIKREEDEDEEDEEEEEERLRLPVLHVREVLGAPGRRETVCPACNNRRGRGEAKDGGVGGGGGRRPVSVARGLGIGV